MFIVFLSMLSGASLMLSLLNGINALKDRPVKLDALLLSISSLGVSVYSLANTFLYSSQSADEFMGINRIDMFCTAIIIISLLIFIRKYTGVGLRYFHPLLIIFFSLVPFIRLTSPTTLTYTAVRGIRKVQLLWGETLSLIDADVSVFGIFYFLFSLSTLFYMTIVSVRYFRQERSSASVFLLCGTTLLTLTALNDMIVDSFSLRWVYLVEFGYTGMLVFMTVSFYHDLLEVARIRSSLALSRRREQEMEKDYEDIFNSSMDGIIVFDSQSGTVIDVNSAILNMLCCEAEDIVGEPMDQFHSGDSPFSSLRFNEYLAKAVEEGNLLFEWLTKNRNDDLLWTEYNLKYTHSGSKGKIIAVVRDISERKATEDLLVQSEKIMSLGGLAAGMAHEINNPLAGIVQTSNVLRNRLIDKLESEVNKSAAREAGLEISSLKSYMENRKIDIMLSSLIEAAKQITSIVNNMLSFSRKSEVIPVPTLLDELVDKTISIISSDYDLKKNYDFKSIDIKREYGSIPPVPCVVTEIQQVIINLLKNGAQAMHMTHTDNPQFIIRTYYEESENLAVLEIEDNGPGMNEEVKNRAFEPFFTTKKEGIGTGLGLSVSNHIIKDNHKGQINVDTSPEKGCRFIIKLPI